MNIKAAVNIVSALCAAALLSACYDDVTTGAADASAGPDAATAHDAAANVASDASDADFTIDRWTITASAGPGGSIAPVGVVPVVEGANQVFSIQPAGGNHVLEVLVDGERGMGVIVPEPRPGPG